VLNKKWPNKDKDAFQAMSDEEVYEIMFGLKKFDVNLDSDVKV